MFLHYGNARLKLTDYFAGSGIFAMPQVRVTDVWELFSNGKRSHLAPVNQATPNFSFFNVAFTSVHAKRPLSLISLYSGKIYSFFGIYH